MNIKAVLFRYINKDLNKIGIYACDNNFPEKIQHVCLSKCNAQCDIFRKQDYRSLAVMRAISFDYRTKVDILGNLSFWLFPPQKPTKMEKSVGRERPTLWDPPLIYG